MSTKELVQELIQNHLQELQLYAQTGQDGYLHPLLEDAIERAQALPKEGDMAGFLKALTDNESYAFQAIVKKIGNEGNISILRMVEETGCSRPVFTSLLTKMEKYQVAFVKNQGVKGTYICMQNEE